MTDLQLLEGLMRGLGSCPTEALRILRYMHSTTTAADAISSTGTVATSCAVQSSCSSNSSSGSSSSSNSSSTRCDTAASSAVDMTSSSNDIAAVTADTVLHLWLLLLESR
jgi:hypothetical protein